MKTISLITAAKILKDSSAIITDDHTVTYPNLNDLTDDPDNEWLTLSWVDTDFNEFETVFTQKDNEQIEIVGSCMFLKTKDGENTVQITVLEPANLETMVAKLTSMEKEIQFND